MPYILGLDAVLAIFSQSDDHPVVRWRKGVRGTELFIGALTFGEMEHVARELPESDAEDRDNLIDIVERILPTKFSAQIIEINPEISREWGRVRHRSRVAGLDITTEEAMEIALARHFGYRYVTRLQPYHAGFDVEVTDPWQV